MRHLTLKTEPFGKGKFKIDLPSRGDATLELFEVIYDSTELDISMEDDGYVVVETESQNEANEVKKVIEDYLNGSLDEANAAKYGDVKGTEPAQKDFDRIEGLITKGGGDGHKVLKLAQNMANTFKTSTSYEKCIRRAKAADKLGYDEIAAIFMKKAEEIKPEKAVASEKRVGKVSYRQDSAFSDNSYYVIDLENEDMFLLKDQSLGKKYKGLTVEYHLNENDEAVDIELVEATAGMWSSPFESKENALKLKELMSKPWLVVNNGEYNELPGAYDIVGSDALFDAIYDLEEGEDARETVTRYLKEWLENVEGFTLVDAEALAIVEEIVHGKAEAGTTVASDFLENKYGNELEEFTIEQFEKDAGPIPALKKFKTAFYSIVHYNKETDKFEILVYPKEADYNKDNPKVVVLDSDLTTVTASSEETDTKSRNTRWGFFGSLTMSPFNLSDADAEDCFGWTVNLISEKTGYMENIVRDFLDSQAGRYLGDMVTYRSFEAGNLSSVFEAVKDTVNIGALSKLRFENFVENYDPADFAEASSESNYDKVVELLELCETGKKEGVPEGFYQEWHSVAETVDFFAEVLNGGLAQYLDHEGDNFPIGHLVQVGGENCKAIREVLREGSQSGAFGDYLEYMNSDDDPSGERYSEVSDPLDELDKKIYENDKIEKACGEILKHYGVL